MNVSSKTRRGFLSLRKTISACSVYPVTTPVSQSLVQLIYSWNTTSQVPHIIRSYSELLVSDNKSPTIKLEPQSIRNIEHLNIHLLVSCKSLCVREVLFLMSHRKKKAHFRIYCSEFDYKKCLARNASVYTAIA